MAAQLHKYIVGIAECCILDKAKKEKRKEISVLPVNLDSVCISEMKGWKLHKI